MLPVTLIADSGSTKAEWCLLENGKTRTYFTQGMSPYFLTTQQLTDILTAEVAAKLKNVSVAKLF
ncbi:MAG TPA: N-acetylglucosamine kinase, partial [Chitinophagaceae bacterium]|nr:N-acetylglucosamine kinase [Chitinophagaceae bacterium]